MPQKRKNPIDKHVGMRVRMRRKMLGMSQEKLGNAIGVTFQQVQKYEKGTNRMGSSRLQQIANVLQVSVPFLFEGVPGPTHIKSDPPSLAYVNDFLATSDGRVLIKAFMQIKDKGVRRRIVEMVEEIAGPEI